MKSFDRILTLWRRWIARRKGASELHLVTQGVDGKDGPVVFAIVRNEVLRLPRFLDHYRALGAAGFVIVDNNSSDGTLDFLRRQQDVCVYTTDGHFRGKEAWLDFLLRKYGMNRWCVVADADELLVYANSDRVMLSDLCRYLQETNCNAIHAILLDLYPAGSVSEVNYVAGNDYFKGEWYFDPFSSLRKAPRHFHRGSGLDYRFHGGTRERMFGVAACCSKFPLFHCGPGMFLSDGQHYLEGGRFSQLRGVLYHFKYLQDFAPHVREEVARGQHWGKAVEYRAYADTIERAKSGLHFHDRASLRYSGTRQLVECEFLTCPDSYVEYLSRMAVAK